MTTVSNNAAGSQPQELVQILRHANGSFDVLYNQPPEYHPGWMDQIVAVLRGVVMSVVNRDNLNENACHYRDGADYNRAVVFLNQMHESFPELQELQELLKDPRYSDLMDFFTPITYLLSSMSQSRLEQFCASFQTILLSSSTVANDVSSARGLVTVTALFGGKPVKVRLTGKIPGSIAGVLRTPYWFVVGNNQGNRSSVKNDRQTPSREAFKEDLKTLRDTAVSTYNKLSAESGLMLTHAQVGSLRSKLLAAVDSFMKEVQTANVHEDVNQQQREHSHADDFRQSVKKTHETDVARNQNNQERRKKEVRGYQKKVENISTETQQQQPEQKVYPRGQTPSIVHSDDFGYTAQVDATVENQHRDGGVVADTVTVMAENGHIAEVPVKPKRVKNDGVKSAFADKLASALKLRSDSPSEQELVALDTALEQGRSSDSSPDVETAMDNGGQLLHSGN
jgi:hypothetical protein